MLELKHVYKIFNITQNREDDRIALEDVNLKIEDGEFVTIIGGNGSGKSTLMNVITGALVPEAGQVILDDEDITNLNEVKRAVFFGRVFQDPQAGTAADMSIFENMMIASRRTKRKGLRWGFNKHDEEIILNKLASLNLGLEDRLEQKVGLLSGGQRQAVTLLMATYECPKILLLDEHTAALDPKTAKIVLEFTDSIVRENHLTTLMITHNMKDAIKYGDRLIMLNNGKIILDVKGEEKKNLTVNALLEKFGSSEDVSLDDTLILNN